jgi:hypothetical protein
MKTAMIRIGQILLIGLVVATGVAGWFGVEKYLLAENAHTLPSLGEGLPTTRLDPPEVQWRRWVRTSVSPNSEQKVWLDLDALEFKADVLTQDPAAPLGTPLLQNQLEGRNDVGYRKPSGSDWIAMEPESATETTDFVLSGTRPRLVTDVVPPAILPFVVLTEEKENDGIRTYSMSVDVPAFRTARPVDFDRWMLSTPNDEELPRSLTIGVRPDGYVVLLENTMANSVAVNTWQEFTGPIPMESPIGPTPVASAPASGSTPPLDSAVPTPPTASVPG